MPIFKIRVIERVYAHYTVEADTEEQALENYLDFNNFTHYSDFVNTEPSTAIIEKPYQKL